jgi:uncharacterized protein YlxP (DUF503 family)
MRFTAAEKLHCLKRELERRKRRYPSSIAHDQMTDASAWREIGLMQAIVNDYADQVESEQQLLNADGANGS